MSTHDAIIQACRDRLRPILMTSAAMILGMMPTAVDNGPGSEFRAPMAIVVIGGVITSTLLTLLVLPSVFLWFDALRRLPRRLFGRGDAPTGGGGGNPTPTLSGAAVLAVLAVGLMAPASVQAERLKLADAIEKAVERNADLKVARARIAEADAQRGKITTAFFPDIKAVGQYTRNSDEAKFDIAAMGASLGAAMGIPLTVDPAKAPPPTIIQAYNQFSAVITADQTIFALAPLLYEKAAEKGMGAQLIGLQAAQREIAYQLSAIYYTVAGLERIVVAAGRAVELAKLRIDMLQRRKAAGTESDLPMLRAQVEQARAEQDVLRAQLGRTQLLEAVGMIIRDVPPEELESPPSQTQPAGTFEDWVARSLESRPDVAARRQAVSAQRSLLLEAQLRWMPILAGQSVLRWSDVKGFVDTNTIWQVTANLVVPLFDRGQRYADARERQATLVRLLAEVEKAESDLRSQIRQAANDIALAQKMVLIADKQAEIAGRGADIARKSLVAGMSTHLEVDEAETNLRLAAANAERERSNWDLAVLKLRHLVGDVRI